MKEPIRILQILNSLSTGGAETFVMNLYRNINRDKIQFDFLLRSTNNSQDLEDEVVSLGGKIYYTAPFPKKFFKNYRQVREFFKNHEEYKIIHLHANSLLYITPFIVAKKEIVTGRILHSHSTRTADNSLYKYLHYFNRFFVKKLGTHFFACSDEAGKWMFKDNEFHIINNAIDTKKYCYNENICPGIRTKLGLEEAFIIGHVGRFVYAKNHSFLIDIFKEIYKRDKSSRLLLIGSGELENETKNKVNMMGLSDKVIFMGNRQDVPELLQVMDVFVFPSHFEGLPIALIEAQASGLICFVSDKVSDKAKITELLEFVPLNESANEWAMKIINSKGKFPKANMFKNICENNFDISDNAVKMEKLYSSMLL